MTTDLPRRRFLVAGAAALAGAAAVGLVVVRDADDEEASGPGGTATTSTAASSSPSPVEGVALVGEAYLRDHPDEADESVLRGHLPELESTEATALLAELSELQPRCQAEFEADDVVLVDGWILARSEARGAALVALAS
jgi:hypothetical protein